MIHNIRHLTSIWAKVIFLTLTEIVMIYHIILILVNAI